MAYAYIDTSVLAIWYLPEAGSEALAAWMHQKEDICISNLTITEFRCLLASHQIASPCGSENTLGSNFRNVFVVEHRLQCPLGVNLIKGSTLLPASWFKRWFGRSGGKHINLADISALIDALSEVVSANESGIQRGLRRLSMAQKQQRDAIALLTQESASLKFALAKRHGMILTYEHILQTLDNLDKIDHAATNVTDHRDVIAPLITRTTEDLLCLCELEIIAVIGKPYPARDCEVIGAVETLEQAQWPPGTVVEVLQQGYQTIEGDVVRSAKVIVLPEAKAVQTHTT